MKEFLDLGDNVIDTNLKIDNLGRKIYKKPRKKRSHQFTTSTYGAVVSCESRSRVMNIRQLKRLIRETVEDVSEQKDYNFTLDPTELTKTIRYDLWNDYYHAIYVFPLQILIKKYKNEHNLSTFAQSIINQPYDLKKINRDKNAMSLFIDRARFKLFLTDQESKKLLKIFNSCISEIINNKTLNSKQNINFTNGSVGESVFNVFVKYFEEYAINKQKCLNTIILTIAKYENQIQDIILKKVSNSEMFFKKFDSIMKNVEQEYLSISRQEIRAKAKSTAAAKQKLNLDLDYNLLYNAISKTNAIDKFIEQHGDEQQCLTTAFETAIDACKTGMHSDVLNNFKILGATTSNSRRIILKLEPIIDALDVFASVDVDNNYFGQYLSTVYDDINELRDYTDYEAEHFIDFCIMCRAVYEATTGINQLIDAANNGDSEAESLLTQFGISV